MAFTDDPALDPDRIAARRFSTSFRGFDPDEVHAFLREIANALRADLANATVAETAAVTAVPAKADPELEAQVASLRAERKRLEARVSELEEQVAAVGSGGELDEARLTELLGAETTRVLETARAAAAKITAKAEEEARTQAESLERRRSTVDQEVANQRREAEEEASARLSAADKKVAALATESQAEAKRVTSEASDEAARTKSAAEREIRKVRSDAEASAQSIKAAANDVAAAVKTRAEDVAKQARLAAESDAESVTAAAETVKAEAEGEAARIRAEAEADAQSSNERAREEARQMVNEAQAVREKILEDLVRRRRIGRQQLDQAKAARDRLARALAEVRKQLDESATELDVSVPEARKAMEMVARRTAPVDAGQQASEMAVDLDTAKASGVPIPGIDTDGADDELDGLFARIRAERDTEPDGAASGGEHSGNGASGEPAAAPAESTLAADSEADGADEAEAEEGQPAEDTQPSIEVPPPFADRDVAATRFGPDVRRKLKRVLADDQSEVLDELRRAKRKASVADLPEADAQVGAVVAAIRPGLQGAADAGAISGGGKKAKKATVDELVGRVAKALSEPLRSKVEASVDSADGDSESLLEPIRAHYRETRATVLPIAVDDALSEAFAAGLYGALADGTALRWTSDPRVDAGPDCYDNTLETSVVKPQPFPTGHLHPLGSPGCRCLVVPAGS